jgi:hypothetical protein
VATVKVLTDSGAGISCVSGEWVRRMALPVSTGASVGVTGVKNGRLVTDSYVKLTVSCPLRPEVSIELTLVVLPEAGEWKCRLPAVPNGLRKHGMYLADPDILGKERCL